MMNKHVVMFDKAYSPEETAEGLAVHWAAITGACSSCKHYGICTSDLGQLWKTMPHDAPCMVYMRESEERMK